MKDIDEKKDNNKNWWQPAILVFTEISSWIAVPIILALFTGKSLDKQYNTKPWIFLLLAVLGFLISSFGIVKAVKRFTKKINNDENVEK